MTVVVVFFSSSIKNTVQVFFVSMADTFDVSRGAFALAVSVFTVAYGVASPVIGRVSDRIGARATITGGVALAAVTFLGCAASPSLPPFVILYGVVGAVAFAAMSYVPIGVLVEESFDPRRRGVAYALLTNAAALGFVILSPLWVHLDGHGSWRTVYAGLGVIFAVPLLVMAARALPSRVGTSLAPAAPLRVGLRRVTGSRAFWVLAVGFFGCGVTMAFIDVHVVAHLEHLHLSSAAISGSLIALGLTEVAGAVLAGWLCDRFDKRYVLGLSYLVRSLGLVVLIIWPSAAGALVFGAVFGLSYMGSVIATTFYAMDAFGAGSRGLAVGLLWLAHQIGAFLSTQLGASSFDALGSYRAAIVTTAFVAMVAAAVSVVGLPHRPHRDQNFELDSRTT